MRSYYFLKGEASIDGKGLLEHDFIKIEDETDFDLVVNSETRLFEIIVPKQLSYKTYLEHVNY